MAIFELLEGLAYAVVYWRVVVMAGLAGLLAWALSTWIASFTAPWCVGMVVIGIVLGMVWEHRVTGRGGPARLRDML